MNRHADLARAGRVAAAIAVALALAGCGIMARSNTTSFSGVMNAASTVPPNPTRASGLAEGWLDRRTNLLRYRITYAGLSGPATAVQFHGPATSGVNAPVVLPLSTVDSPIEGQAMLTPSQAADLSTGKWYVDVRTAAHPGGEIRGQMLPLI